MHNHCYFLDLSQRLLHRFSRQQTKIDTKYNTLHPEIKVGGEPHEQKHWTLKKNTLNVRHRYSHILCTEKT